ncbi:hypothetical protein A3C20_04375 [Candidatus Kaiserbacteria bacterium RIFCSPHIGHO2_02_FULL_55_25]|uniref:histidine kinase n=1 Tax=Candidatus Kaiserbacteria bacterium RIFCSPHIGHO2_02_FULL_55_25 TaxID=1798498 RepID=A0A1F6EAN1_9BACT|nr:MAG: hypothetical protein A2764_03840 [Candidatus Kaiserbacteria bacterium RIFCSPHIGHO2_01_FULL_55_79]OGG70729.1 MAG: hypothetical protein A3C20_04375 [Candidatus Kaiserbacteria bacterium RIFCSPHIGHO2_02_FULL_55_25]OGG77105.1 MAG: hypothetical protein A3F56_03100 [Candidatus Kaiserbacteria bacterium RIFCSPHIGHO2_12_FULL_55_13]OGG84032.1 MAG: hypothetical protein A3A42_03215 [Candidatus Kaiserbacteria bacterium RIFCSPLOWO2_01_FULL_55_25]
MLNITNSILLMTALFNAGSMIVLLRGNVRRRENALFAIFLAALSIWALALIGSQVTNSYIASLYSTKASYIAALVIGVTYYLFSYSFPRSEAFPRSAVWIPTLAVLLFSVVLLVDPSFLTQAIVQYEWGRGVQLDLQGYLTFALLFGALFVGGIARLWAKYLVASGIERTQLLVIVGSVTIAGAAGIFYNLILPSPFLNNAKYIWTGPLFTTCIAIAVMYSVFRLQLFNAKVMITELLIGLLWITTFLRTILAANQTEQMFNGLLFVLSLAIGSLLVRSVRTEVRSREEIQRLSEEKSEFMTFASHEIRNPITAMRGYASLIVDGTVDHASPEVKAVAQKILIGGNDVLNLIAQFLSKSKMELGQISYNSAPFDLAAAASSIADGYVPHAQLRGLTLEKKIDESHQYTIKADEGKVKEVIGNLIDNSLKYTVHGGVTVAVERHGVAVRLTISDTGVGIAPETLPHLFKKFSRADAQKVNLLGTGVGLYLAKTFIEAMGGRIWAESDGKDKGSRFILEFPTQ